jgi:hypothetical protein
MNLPMKNSIGGKCLASPLRHGLAIALPGA